MPRITPNGLGRAGGYHVPEASGKERAALCRSMRGALGDGRVDATGRNPRIGRSLQHSPHNTTSTDMSTNFLDRPLSWLTIRHVVGTVCSGNTAGADYPAPGTHSLLPLPN